MSSPHKLFRDRALRALRVGLGGLVAAAWLGGLARFVAAEPPFEATLPRQTSMPGDETNLANWRFGPTVRASSYHRDPFAHHHPFFAVDGRLAPSLVEKWMSAASDAHPWIEITWREPHDLNRVVVRHAGEYEADAYTLGSYTLTCLRDGGGSTVTVKGNRARVAIHQLPCPHARGIRLAAQPRAGEGIRIFELEAWGQ